MSQESLDEAKQRLRRAGLAARRGLADAAERSRQAVSRLVGLKEYQRSRSVLFYVSARSELETHDLVQQELADSKRQVLVPWCRGNELELYRLRDWSELAVGAFGILEPDPSLRARAERRGRIEEVDLVVVPGVAFDRRGGRIGHGQGYYDRLLGRSTGKTVLVGLCYAGQLMEEVPRADHDVLMDLVVTEEEAVRCER